MDTKNYLLVIDATRHGETTSNLMPGYMGGREPELEMTPRGIQQINDLGDRYSFYNIKPDIIYTSMIPRAITCGQVLAKKLRIDEMTIQSTSTLDEIDMGHWAGKLRSEVLIGDALLEFQKLGRDFKGHGGESHNEVTDRVRIFLNECIRTAEQSMRSAPLHIVAFTHFTTIKCMFNAIVAGGHQSPEARIYNGRTMRICFHRQTRKWELHGLNLTDMSLGE